jgi:predicted metal-dependent HD superfamily phosphohydrolase
MTNPIIKIVNAQTGEELEREMNAVEFASYQKDLSAEAERQAEAQTKAQAKAALLAQLGITEEQAKLLLS